VLNAVVSVFYYLRLVINLYMREADEPAEAAKAHPGLIAALVIALIGVLWLGVAPGGLLGVFDAAAVIGM